MREDKVVLQFSDCRVSVIPNFIYKVKLVTVDLTLVQLLLQTTVTHMRDLIFYVCRNLPSGMPYYLV